MNEHLERLTSALAGRYTIGRELGAGGMATVYLAHDVKHDRQVAVKVLRPELAAVIGAERFLHEIKVTANLQHPHILALFDSGESESFLFYVMPYVDGESLRERLVAVGQLSIENALTITSQVADALESEHRQGVVHRDIKPENILLREGHALVADFGIALAVKSAAGEWLTETGLSLGTPPYMSPEQIAGDREIDNSSDIYSLACVLYEMLAGEPPFTGPNAQAIVARHMTDPVPPITTVRSSVPQPVAAAIMKALGKAPIDRFESAKAFAEALFAESADGEPEAKSIVVLPFENLSSDPEQEYFSDGLTEEVISDLSKVQALRVISRSSAMTFKGSSKKIPEIARELNVHYVLEGSVRKAGNNLRITAQLIDATSDVHVWSDKYNGTLDDVFDMQEKVARAIAEALEVKLTPEESRRVAHRPTTNVHAYECYMRARNALHQYTKEGHDSAIRHIESGLEVTGDNALLYAGLAYVYAWWGNTGVVDAEESYQKAETYAQKALALDPDIAQAHLALGMAHCYMRWDIRKAYGEFELAGALDPSDWDTQLQLAFFYISVGRLSRALKHAQAMVALDPTNPVSLTMVGYVRMLEGQAEVAVDIMEGAGLDLLLPWHMVWIAWAYMQAARPEEALAVLAPVQHDPDLDFMASMCLVCRAALQRDRSAFAEAKTPQCVGVCARDPAAAFLMADAHAVLGDTDGALEWLERAADVGWINFPVLNETDVLLEGVRGAPRFQALLQRVKREWEEFGRELEEGGAL